MKSFPAIKKLFPSLVAQDLVGVQSMSHKAKFSLTKHWCIKAKNDKWILETWFTVDGLFLLKQKPEKTEREFPTEAAAKETMVLEQLEQ